ncbi:hypothetical protein STEG23_001200, partial [Scotinomys teguina]
MSHAEITLSGPDPLHSLNVRGYGYSHTRSPGAHGHLAGHGSPSAGQDVTSDSLICIITTICSVQVSKWSPAVTACLSVYEEMTQRIRIASFNFLLYTSAKENFPKVTKGAPAKIQDDAIKKERPYRIFFKDLFLFKENEMAAKKKEKLMSRSMKIYQKTTFSSRMKSRSHLGQLTFYSEAHGGSDENLGLDPTLILRLTEGADRKRTLHEFINDQRDRFLLEYAVSTKKNTIQRFEKLITGKESQLRKAEKKLQADAISFEEFLRENDQRSVDALKMAAQETMNKIQMTTELKKASMEVQSIKSEIAKTEFLLKEYMKYGFFLLKLSPKHWQLQQSQKRAQAAKSNSVLPRILD